MARTLGGTLAAYCRASPSGFVVYFLFGCRRPAHIHERSKVYANAEGISSAEHDDDAALDEEEAVDEKNEETEESGSSGRPHCVLVLAVTDFGRSLLVLLLREETGTAAFVSCHAGRIWFGSRLWRVVFVAFTSLLRLDAPSTAGQIRMAPDAAQAAFAIFRRLFQGVLKSSAFDECAFARGLGAAARLVDAIKGRWLQDIASFETERSPRFDIQLGFQLKTPPMALEGAVFNTALKGSNASDHRAAPLITHVQYISLAVVVNARRVRALGGAQSLGTQRSRRSY